jgi:hypothetical protein
MEIKKTKGIENLEKKMEAAGADAMRYSVLKNAKEFKTSWIDLGQALYTVWTDKLYKDWGYRQFDTYTSKEIGIRKETAVKLLKSYSFLEKKEPRYLDEEYRKNKETASVPTYEAVDVLRMADSRKDIERSDYAKIRKYVLEEGKDARDVKKNLTRIIREKEELDPQGLMEKKSVTLLKRLLGALKAVRTELKGTNVISQTILKDTDSLIQSLEKEVC